jgi:hypothetical protein
MTADALQPGIAARRLAGWLIAAAILTLGCGPLPPGQPLGDGGTFVAFGPDFRGFSSWTALALENPTPGGSTHVAGTRTIYINAVPAVGATEFPVGTIIVKRTEADGKLFARAKRGGTFNPRGAIGWEWFELVETAQHEVAIRWRGLGPPLGEVYGGDPNAGCNMCHKLAIANDYVLAPGLMLARPLDADAVDAAVESDTGTGAGDATHE